MLVTMSDGKQTQPTIVLSSQQDERRTETNIKFITKLVIIAVVCVVIAGLLVTAVLVGIRLISDSNEEILKLSLSLKSPGNSDSRQAISTDANANIVIYDIKQNGLNITVNNDFDKDIQVIKIVSVSSVECYVTPLNRSNAFDLKSLPLPADYNTSSLMNLTVGKTVHLSYEPAPTPINDTTFLGKRANALCDKISVYWLRPTCTESVVDSSTAVGNHTRSKRATPICSCSTTSTQFCIFGKCFSLPGEISCKCCLATCVNLDLSNPCVLCNLLTSVWANCATVCNAIYLVLNPPTLPPVG